MVHKTSIIPGLSQFLDNTVLSHYPPTSIKRIVAAGAIALYWLGEGADWFYEKIKEWIFE